MNFIIIYVCKNTCIKYFNLYMCYPSPHVYILQMVDTFCYIREAVKINGGIFWEKFPKEGGGWRQIQTFPKGSLKKRTKDCFFCQTWGAPPTPHLQLWLFFYGIFKAPDLVCLFSCNGFWKQDLLNLTNFGAVYLTQFLTDFSQILDSKSYDQA